ncbi:helix-turn-helix domain-containing protein [Paraburkholderia rhizosphaerae]|uniref:Transcriptional regulator GlxA family with amidase domain n=1 Tax=Paraburkholderia rhizosphaerae TaxID=480658 RepID=A0A4V3HEZ3_9BURK|nr:helix-turn-helix domain-containing protein [Paraburkholderia rhizosphaerae]TDY50801.1 transcriptional regulator GlxA family with amidase domain [Paraburkholderia rhizosphaerae]
MSWVDYAFTPARRLPRGAPHLIGIVLFDQFSLLQAAEVADVFEKANRLDAGRSERRYKTVFLSTNGEQVTSSLRIAVLTQRLPDQSALQLGFRALFIAGGDGAAQAVDDSRLLSWLIDASAAVDTVCAIGEGGAILDAARAHRPAAPHCTPAASAVQTALETVRHDLGADIARDVATQLSWTSLPKPISVALDNHEPTRQKIRDSAQWIARNCDKRISITTAAQQAGMSERSYLRHFRAEMGIKPSEHLRRTRVQLASALLAQSDLPVDKIARRCGLTSGECLARLFRQIVQISPTEYRSRVRREPA